MEFTALCALPDGECVGTLCAAGPRQEAPVLTFLHQQLLGLLAADVGVKPSGWWQKTWKQVEMYIIDWLRRFSTIELISSIVFSNYALMCGLIDA